MSCSFRYALFFFLSSVSAAKLERAYSSCSAGKKETDRYYFTPGERYKKCLNNDSFGNSMEVFRDPLCVTGSGSSSPLPAAKERRRERDR